MKLGIIGTSTITTQFLEACQLVGGIDLHSVYSRRLEKAEQFGNQYGAKKVFDDLEAFFSDEDLEAVYIASPNSLHYEQAKQALEHDVNVFLEKPVTSTLKEWQDLVQTAFDHEVYLMEAARHLYEPNFQKVTELVLSFDKIDGATLSYGKYSSKMPAYLAGENPNIFNPAFSGGAIMDLGVYVIHAAIAWFGAPNEAMYVPKISQTGVDLSGTGVLRYDDFNVTILCSKDTNLYLESEIYSGQKTIRLPELTAISKIVLSDGDKDETVAVEPAKQAMNDEVARFKALVAGEVSEEDYHDQLNHSAMVINVIEKMRQSAHIFFPADKLQNEDV